MLTKINLCKYLVVVSSFLLLLGIQSGFASRQFSFNDEEESKILLAEAEELTERTAEFGQKDFKQLYTSLFYGYLKAFFYSGPSVDINYRNRLPHIHSGRLFLKFHNLRIP